MLRMHLPSTPAFVGQQRAAHARLARHAPAVLKTSTRQCRASIWPGKTTLKPHILSVSTAVQAALVDEAVEDNRSEVSTSSDGDDSSAREQQIVSDDDLELNVPDHILQRNRDFSARLKNKLILAPLTRGGNLPFRKLCANFGCDVTMSEMAFAKPLLKGDRVERARLSRADNEGCYGFQIATKVISEGVEAARLAKESGASWLDINVGCPIYEASRRGLGAVMLRKPRSLAKLVHGIVMGSDLPVTVKIRTGETDKKINVARVAKLLERAGAAAVTIHGRTMEQRYRKPADWSYITGVVTAQPELPVIGNGDVITHYEVTRRFQQTGVHSVMTGRGALIRPWLFKEYQDGREMLLTPEDRVAIYRELVVLMKQHFGDDALGRRKAWYFLPWHFAFLHRYRQFPEAVYGPSSQEYPLILTRCDTVDPRVGEDLDSLDLLERLLRNESEKAHEEIAAALWDSASDQETCAALRRLADEKLLGWEADSRAKGPLEPGRGGGSGVGGPGRGRRGGGGESEEY